MHEVIVITDPFDVNSASKHLENDVRDFYLKVWLEHPSAKIYHQDFAIENDVTQACVANTAEFHALSGRFIVVCKAEWNFVIAAVVALVVGIAVALLMPMPTMPDTGGAVGSTNNSFSERVNKHRIDGAVPDMYGTNHAVPDLLVRPYIYFKDNVENEELVLGVGKGFYEIPASSVKDGDTNFSEVPGAEFEIFNPGHDISTGIAFNEAPFVGSKSNSINGQTLLNPNFEKSNTSGVYFEYPNVIRVLPNTVESITLNRNSTVTRHYVDFTERFTAGENIVIDGASFGVADETFSGSLLIATNGTFTVTMSKNIEQPENFKRLTVHAALANDLVNGTLDFAGQYQVLSIVKAVNSTNPSLFDYTITFDDPHLINGNFNLITADLTSQLSAVASNNIAGMSLNGEYQILSVEELAIYLVSPTAENSDWEKLQYSPGQTTNGTFPQISLSGSQENWIGWFICDVPFATMISANFVAQNGLYQGKYAKHVDIELEVQQVDSNSVPVGTVKVLTGQMVGKSNDRNQIGLTLRDELGFSGSFRFRVRRLNSNGTAQDLVDEVKIRDVYAGYFGQTIYDDITVMRTRMQATEKALGVKERRVNCLPTRQLYNYRGGVRSASREANNVAANTLVHLALDAGIGRLDPKYIDFDSIYSTVDNIISYFGSEEAAWFCYTFDDLNMSAKEKLAIVGKAIFSTAYQMMSKLYLQFERKTEMSKLLFNHRNKDPEADEVWTRSFGFENNYDGIEFEYVNPDDGSKKTIYLPDEYVSNPKKVSITGVRSHIQAQIHAHRAWNRLKYQRIGVKFGAYGEADLITVLDPILVAKNINTRFKDGEVVKQNALVLTLSQSFEFMPGEITYIHLQMRDATVDVIQITPGESSYEVILSRPPLLNVVTEGKKTTYVITSDLSKRRTRFLVSEKASAGLQRSEVTAVNYDDRYYNGDLLHLA